MKTPRSVFFLLPLLGVAAACNPPRPCTDEVVCESYVHRYGVPLPQDEWVERGKNGQVVSTQKDGVIVTRNYEGGMLQGESTYSFPHRDRIQKKEIYDRGGLARELYFNSSGIPQQEIVYNYPDRKSITVWYENGSPQLCESYESNQLISGEYYDIANRVESQVNGGDGFRTRRDGLGQLQSIDTIDQGQMTLRTTYHANGAPDTVTPYANGTIHGLRRTYQVGGEPATVETWTNNKQHGITTIYENGEKLSEIPYVNGRQHGMERRYRDGEVVAQEVTWVGGQKQGPCYTYVGNTRETDWYFGDKLVNKATYDVMRSQ